ncbi:MAG: hypothetical protein MK082_02935 [Phycisphaerales bacterium]|nr:hypothetical protein [Phycisphaerales bacterium]
MKKTLATVLTTVLALATTTGAATTNDDNAYKQLIDDHASSIVTVKFVMNVSMGGGGGGMDREIPVEIDGIVVSDDGLIMIPGAPMDMANQMRRQMRGRRGGRGGGGGGGMPDMEIEASPTDIRVVMGDDFEEYDAVLAAKDSTLQLAFVMLEDTEDLKLSPLKLDADSEPGIGEELLALARLNEEYDYAPYFATVQITGSVNQPRRMWCISTQLFSPGLPVFNHAGAFIGIMGDGTSGGDDAGMGGMMGGQSGYPFLIPVKQVAPIVKQAHERGKAIVTGEGAGA